jgi:hypothetical protein
MKKTGDHACNPFLIAEDENLQLPITEMAPLRDQPLGKLKRSYRFASTSKGGPLRLKLEQAFEIANDF